MDFYFSVTAQIGGQIEHQNKRLMSFHLVLIKKFNEENFKNEKFNEKFNRRDKYFSFCTLNQG